MILVDRNIRDMLTSGKLAIEPLRPGSIQAASVDVHLSRHFSQIALASTMSRAMDPFDEVGNRSWTIGDDSPQIIQPGEFMLASTIEKFKFPTDVAGRLEGKSSLGRLGLIIHTTAGFFDPGFVGHATLELSNMCSYPINLYPGMPVGQMCFIACQGPAVKPYGGKYQDQGERPAPSQYWRNTLWKEQL